MGDRTLELTDVVRSFGVQQMLCNQKMRDPKNGRGRGKIGFKFQNVTSCIKIWIPTSNLYPIIDKFGQKK